MTSASDGDSFKVASKNLETRMVVKVSLTENKTDFIWMLGVGTAIYADLLLLAGKTWYYVNLILAGNGCESYALTRWFIRDLPFTFVILPFIQG